MNRRSVLAILIGGTTSLYSRFARAGNRDEGPPAALIKSPGQSGARVGAHGQVAGASRGFPDLKLLPHDHQVRSLVFSRGAYRVEKSDGKNLEYLEEDLRFKIDSSDLGPRAGEPIIMPAGTEGDRVWVFFASPAEISSFINYDFAGGSEF